MVSGSVALLVTTAIWVGGYRLQRCCSLSSRGVNAHQHIKTKLGHSHVRLLIFRGVPRHEHYTDTETEFITVFQDNGLLDKSRSSARLAAGCNSLDAASLWKHTYSTALAFRRPRLFGLGPGLIFGSVTMWSRHCRRCASRLTWLGLPL